MFRLQGQGRARCEAAAASAAVSTAHCTTSATTTSDSCSSRDHLSATCISCSDGTEESQRPTRVVLYLWTDGPLQGLLPAAAQRRLAVRDRSTLAAETVTCTAVPTSSTIAADCTPSAYLSTGDRACA